MHFSRRHACPLTLGLLAACLAWPALASPGGARRPDFGGKLFTEKMAPARGKLPVLAILWDPHRADNPAPPAADIDRMLFGPRPSVADWYRENSGGRVALYRAGTLGWYDADKPADHYWNTSPEKDPKDADGDGWLNGHVEKWAEAIRKADRDFAFRAYDRNHDGVLGSNELGILVVIPQKGAFGTVRNVVGREAPEAQPLIVDGVKVDAVAEWYTGTPPNFGAPTHELAHLLLGAPDMYQNVPFAPRAFSLMDISYTTGHLDAFEKLKLGWLRHRTVTRTGEYDLRDVETRQEALILYDPRRGPGEYFLIENRWCGTSYDAGVPGLGSGIPASGVAVWHIVEDPGLLGPANLPAGIGPHDWGRAGVRLVRANGGQPIDDRQALLSQRGAALSDDTTPARLRWADGSPTGFRVSLLTDAGPKVRVRIEASR